MLVDDKKGGTGGSLRESLKAREITSKTYGDGATVATLERPGQTEPGLPESARPGYSGQTRNRKTDYSHVSFFNERGEMVRLAFEDLRGAYFNSDKTVVVLHFVGSGYVELRGDRLEAGYTQLEQQKIAAVDSNGEPVLIGEIVAAPSDVHAKADPSTWHLKHVIFHFPSIGFDEAGNFRPPAAENDR